MGENKNQKVLEEAILKALDDVELEGVDGGYDKKQIAKWSGIAATTVLAALGLGYGGKKLYDNKKHPISSKVSTENNFEDGTTETNSEQNTTQEIDITEPWE